MRYGTYPWSLDGSGNDPAKTMAAMKLLKGKKQLQVHLYGQFMGPADAQAQADHIFSDAQWWSSNGFAIEPVLRYRPSGSGQVSAYASWCATLCARFAALRGLAQVCIANEPNVMTPADGDGSYPDVIQAIVDGVIAAKGALVGTGRPGVKVGFNWAAGETPQVTEPLWGELKNLGGPAFAERVGWVGVDVYPGTWSPPPASTNSPTTAQITQTIADTLVALRTKHMAAAGLPSTATITVAETGWPTSPTRTEGTQVNVLSAIDVAVRNRAASCNVNGLNWFLLRDSHSSSGELVDRYGLLRDDYSQKPAFARLRARVASYGS